MHFSIDECPFTACPVFRNASERDTWFAMYAQLVRCQQSLTCSTASGFIDLVPKSRSLPSEPPAATILPSWRTDTAEVVPPASCTCFFSLSNFGASTARILQSWSSADPLNASAQELLGGMYSSQSPKGARRRIGLKTVLRRAGSITIAELATSFGHTRLR